MSWPGFAPEPEGLPEHNCEPYGEHCAGHCPGPAYCARPAHQPPRGGNGVDSVWRGEGIWRPWDCGGAGPMARLVPLAVTGEDSPDPVRPPPRIAGPSR